MPWSSDDIRHDNVVLTILFPIYNKIEISIKKIPYFLSIAEQVTMP